VISVKRQMRNFSRVVISVCTMLVSACASGLEGKIAQRQVSVRVATWNIAHLGEAGEGCVPRTQAQIAAIRDYARALDAEVISFQEVASEAAAEAVFPREEWQLFISRRVYDRPQPQCRQDRSKVMGHMRTGFAVRRPLVAEWQPELNALGDTLSRPNEEPHGVDLLLNIEGRQFRMLSIHLTSGCSAGDSAASPSCAALFSQAPALRSWVDAREANGEDWLILGDFNRFWERDDPFWSSALGDQRETAQFIPQAAGSIDHIVAARTQMGTIMTGLEQPDSAISQDLSDHEPVIAEIRFNVNFD
jgi:endonuclease/exonuclease/phosphatase family metal-dependent hydrolase